MRLVVNLSCSSNKAEVAAYEFCVKALQSGIEIHRLFFSGSVVTSVLNSNSTWMALCQANKIDGVCCSYSVEQHSHSEIQNSSSIDSTDLPSQKNALDSGLTNDPHLPIKRGGLALLVESAIKSDLIVNFTDTHYSVTQAIEKIEQNQKNSAITSKNCPGTYLLSLRESKNQNTTITDARKTDTLTSEYEDHDNERLQRLVDTASVFLIFEQNIHIALDTLILKNLYTKKLVQQIQTLRELDSKKLTFSFIKPDKTNEPSLTESALPEQLTIISRELRSIGLNCDTYADFHYQNEYPNKHIVF